MSISFLQNWSGASGRRAELFLYLQGIFSDRLFIGLMLGVTLSALIAAIIVSRNPNHAPLFLRYTCRQCYETLKLAETRDKKSPNEYESLLVLYQCVKYGLLLIVLIILLLCVVAYLLFA